jgi:hypothetical protein
MSTDLNKAQAKAVAEKTAIIANTAFMLGREAEAKRVIDIIKAEMELHRAGSSGRGTVERIIDLLSSKDKSNA